MKFFSKKILATIFCVLLITLFTACNNSNEKTYQTYVKSLISVNYLGASSDYIKATGANEEDAQDLFNANIKHLADNLMVYYSLEIPEESETMEQLLTISSNLYSKIKFDVSKAYKEGNDYYVDVTIEPLNILNDTNSTINQYVSDFNTKVNNGEYRDYTKEEYEKEFADGLLVLLSDSVNSVTYDTAQVIKVKIITTDSTYYISDEDFIAIDSIIIAGSTPISSISETVDDVLDFSESTEVSTEAATTE